MRFSTNIAIYLILLLHSTAVTSRNLYKGEINDGITSPQSTESSAAIHDSLDYPDLEKRRGGGGGGGGGGGRGGGGGSGGGSGGRSGGGGRGSPNTSPSRYEKTRI